MIICRKFKFDAAHYLPLHKGKCQKLHGHTWHVEVAICGKELTDGMLMDFAELKEIAYNKVISLYDHQCLNDFYETPTAENLALTLRRLINLGLPEGITVHFIRVWESDDSYAQVGGE